MSRGGCARLTNVGSLGRPRIDRHNYAASKFEGQRRRAFCKLDLQVAVCVASVHIEMPGGKGGRIGDVGQRERLRAESFVAIRRHLRPQSQSEGGPPGALHRLLALTARRGKSTTVSMVLKRGWLAFLASIEPWPR